MPKLKKRKKDWAEQQTDKLLNELEGKIVREYRQALKEAQEKYNAFVQRFIKEDEQKLKDVQTGKITQQQYVDWQLRKLSTDARGKAMVDMLAQDLALADQKALSIINGYMPEAYATNFNYATYDIERNTHINTSFTLYNRDTVERLLRDDPGLLPRRKVDIPADKRWNRQHINSAITQGVLQGDSIPKIASRLQQVTDMDRRAAVRNARTMMTGAQNAGRMDAFGRAADLGIHIQKQWIATLDTRTRDSHAALDGEIKELDEKFTNGLMEPGDPTGDPAEVYNCRCTVLPYYPEYEDENVERYVEGTNIDGFYTYEEWANSKMAAPGAAEQVNVDHRAWIDKAYSNRYTEADRAEIARLYSQSPNEIQQLYGKYGGQMNAMVDNARSKAGFFSPSGQYVQLNGKMDIAGSDYESKYQVSCHEFGHYMDFLAGGKNTLKYFSQNYQNASGQTFGQIIKGDWDAVFQQRYPNTKVTAQVIVDFCSEIKKRYSLMERADLSDMFEKYSVTHGGPAYPFGVGHGTTYARKGGSVEKETFAEMISATVANPDSLALIKKYLPNAYEAFLDMIRQEVSR